jgi:predicted DNA-binding protein (MmcQ/YjbR family)
MPAEAQGQSLLTYCLAKPGAWQDEPWEGDVVAKVGPQGKGKIFAFLGDGTGVGLKCGSRDEADELVARYPDDVRPSAYIGRHGWNSVRLGGAVPYDEVLELADASYDEIVAKLPRAQRPA